MLDEKRLLSPLPEGGLGYEVEELAYVSGLLVPFGGLKDIGLQAGETVIVSPATGGFGGAAVLVALAMGARVIAMGRDRAKLEKLREKVGGGRVEVVPMTGDVEADAKSLKTWGEVDAFFDISPPEAAKSTHMKSGILALRKGGRVSLMGGIREDVGVPHGRIMHWNLTLKGKVRMFFLLFAQPLAWLWSQIKTHGAGVVSSEMGPFPFQSLPARAMLTTEISSGCMSEMILSR